MWMKKAEFGLGNKTIVGSCSNALRNTNPRGRVPLRLDTSGRVPFAPYTGGWVTPQITSVIDILANTGDIVIETDSPFSNGPPLSSI